MTTILRIVAILALLALALIVWAAAFAVAATIAPLPIDVGAIVGADNLEVIKSVSWPEVVLWGGAGLFFLISSIRLMRRTQAWFMWFMGFACLVGRWVLGQGGVEQAVSAVQGVDVGAYLKPEDLLGDVTAPEVQVGRFGVLLLLGLIVLIVDLADRAHWKREEG
ncbi:MAG TPA: hypothetical protein DHW63_11560 [Hyphomonadaceae bacterium]|nr:hypothetical protein [Hyphomonadaceae bacterium]